MTPQMTVVADLTRSEDLLSLKPGYAVGDFFGTPFYIHKPQAIFTSRQPKLRGVRVGAGLCLEGVVGGRGGQRFVDQKSPKENFPLVNFMCSHAVKFDGQVFLPSESQITLTTCFGACQTPSWRHVP